MVYESYCLKKASRGSEYKKCDFNFISTGYYVWNFFCFLILFLQITKKDQSSDFGLFPCKFGTFNKVIDMYTCWLKTDLFRSCPLLVKYWIHRRFSCRYRVSPNFTETHWHAQANKQTQGTDPLLTINPSLTTEKETPCETNKITSSRLSWFSK